MLMLLGLIILTILLIPVRFYLRIFPSSGMPQLEVPVAYFVVLAVAAGLAMAAVLFHSVVRDALSTPGVTAA